jgi:hypothetical protein
MVEIGAQPARTARPEPAVASPPPTRPAPSLPYIRVKRTKTAGWQVVHVCKSGRRVVRVRRLDFKAAIMAGAAAARVNSCELEVDP